MYRQDSFGFRISEQDRASLSEQAIQKMQAISSQGLFGTMEALGLMRAPMERAERVERLRDKPFGSSGQRLDIWRPALPEPLPIAVFVHGGGFSALSKDTHWMFARALARAGFLTISLDYRLAPAHPFPAALEDVCQGLRWCQDNAERHGGDLDRLMLIGESAGANLALAAGLCSLLERPEAFATALRAQPIAPAAIVLLSGLLDVHRVRERYRRAGTPALVRDLIAEACEAYLPQQDELDSALLASPLRILEQLSEQDLRKLPACFAASGGDDPLREDSERLQAAWPAVQLQRYSGGVHSFMAFLWRSRAQRCWEDLFTFCQRIGLLEAHEPGEEDRR